MFCQYQYYREETKQLQAALHHNDESYQCWMSDCPYTGTTLINKIPWGDCPAGEEQGETEADTDSEERSTSGEQRDEQSEDTWIVYKIKRLFRK